MTLESRSANARMIRIVFLSLAVLMLVFIVFERFIFLPKILMVGVILLAAVVAGKIKLLVRDWFVFLAFIYLFDSLRGIIYLLTCKLQLPAYALYVLNIEKSLFGGVPSVVLQKALLHPDPAGNFTWLEKGLTVSYGSHFLAFLLVGFLIWLSRPKDFSLYKNSFYLLIFIGVFFYALVPTVPPWMAANHFGLLPPLTHFNIDLFNVFIPDLSNGFDTNPIAAMPSLHAGFPILCCCLLWRLYRWKGIPFYLYALSVLFAIVYTGDHYVTDILAGLVLAVACYLLAARILGKRQAALEDASGPESGASFGWHVLRSRILLGLGIFLIGVIMGGINKTQFRLNANLYNQDIPRYVDFFRTEARFRDNYYIQAYLGNHFLSLKDCEAALPYFERSLELARNHSESKEASQRIGFCRRALGQKT